LLSLPRVTVKVIGPVPLSPSAADASAIEKAPGVGGGGAAPKLWPLLAPPGVSSELRVQMKSPASSPLPVRPMEVPSALPGSETPTSMLVMPAAGPFVAVMTPS